MANRLEITNMAILLIGEEALASVDDGTKTADIADVFFDLCLETALSEHNWTFARKRVTLSPDVEEPEFGYSAKFLFPPDYNHICIEETDEDMDFREESGYIHYSAEEIELLYIANITNLSLLSPKFVDALATLLASKMAFSVTGSEKVANSFEALYEKRLQKAKGQDGLGVGLVDDTESWEEDR